VIPRWAIATMPDPGVAVLARVGVVPIELVTRARAQLTRREAVRWDDATARMDGATTAIVGARHQRAHWYSWEAVDLHVPSLPALVGGSGVGTRPNEQRSRPPAVEAPGVIERRHPGVALELEAHAPAAAARGGVARARLFAVLGIVGHPREVDLEGMGVRVRRVRRAAGATLGPPPAIGRNRRAALGAAAGTDDRCRHAATTFGETRPVAVRMRRAPSTTRWAVTWTTSASPSDQWAM